MISVCVCVYIYIYIYIYTHIVCAGEGNGKNKRRAPHEGGVHFEYVYINNISTLIISDQFNFQPYFSL